jgi:hypothetical protein
MNIKIRVNGRKLVPCAKCGMYYKGKGKKKVKVCTSCKKEVAV